MSATQSTAKTRPIFPGASLQGPIDALVASNNKTQRGTVAIDLPSMLTHAEGTGTAAIAGSKTTDFVTVNAPSALDAGVLVKRAWISGDGTLSVTVYNTTAGTIDPASGSFEYAIVSNDTITVPVASVTSDN